MTKIQRMICQLIRGEKASYVEKRCDTDEHKCLSTANMKATATMKELSESDGDIYSTSTEMSA